MFTIKGTNITITRGDTARFKLDIKDEDGNTFDQTGATVLMTVKKSYKDSDYLIQKTAQDGVITFVPSDTSSLSFATCIYDVQVTTESGDVCTVIPPSQFVIDKEVTWTSQEESQE